MTTASLEAYQNIVDKLVGKRAIIFESISTKSILGHKGRTINELCMSLDWPYNTTSARVCELTDRGLIKENGIRKGQTVWIPSEPEEVDSMRAARAAARKAMKTPRVRRLEDALRGALDLLESDGDRHNAWRAALNDTSWPPEDS